MLTHVAAHNEKADCMGDPMNSATVSLEEVGGRTLRVAHWRLDEPSDHPPILFFNGIGANIEAVAPLAEAMPERGFIIFDMPGVGESPEPVLPYNPFTMCWTAAQLLDSLGSEEVDVMGVSWGGAMAQHFALQHGGRTRKLVLAATTPGMLMVPGKWSALSKMVDPRRYVDPNYMNEHFATLYGGMTRDTKATARRDHIGRIKPPSPRGYLYQLIAMLGWTSAPALPFLKKDTLVMMGGDDRIVVPANGKILAGLIPNAKLVEFEDGGHLFLLTHSEEAVAEIRAFLDEGEALPEAA
ncbi:alpha/beta fold hydrolase [Blastomonas marina]|jgi:poly(3-hydroxyalkanoate) depolymerase|uniref:alpha/beta fold hydrolase n=1 Tax=Blastomonas marina TaxID=1867408 RepID=UPI00269506D4|nr:alpha/beta fold hydrolase [Blastomonas marina]WPZ04548.1 alpha/beta fold hydrolase [Blastomonas marina]